MKKQSIVIGLTGGIATGKSAVLSEFRRLGAKVIDCDKLAREAVKKGAPALNKIKKSFGSEILSADGTLNREMMGKLVFGSPDNKEKIEKIIHPEVLKKVLQAIKRVRRGIVIVDVPLLFEAGWEKYFDETIVVHAPKSLQIKRLFERNHLTPSQSRLRINAQMPLRKKLLRADHAIDNSGALRKTFAQTKRLYQSWISSLSSKNNFSI